MRPREHAQTLIGDGLMEFVGWEALCIDEAMRRVRAVDVGQYEESGGWAFSVWLRLSDAGTAAARVLNEQDRTGGS